MTCKEMEKEKRNLLLTIAFGHMTNSTPMQMEFLYLGITNTLIKSKFTIALGNKFLTTLGRVTTAAYLLMVKLEVENPTP